MDLTVDQLKPADAAWPHRGYAWWVVVALMIAYAFSIVDRTALGLLVQPIEADLHISDTLMGLLQGTAFALFYAVLGLPLGLLADRINRRRLITAGIAVWSAATMACGLASGFAGLFAARLGVGAGEATLSPAGASLIADYFPAEERPKAYGVYAVGTSIGGGMAFLLGGAAIALAGHLRLMTPGVFGALAYWKIVFLLIGAPGLLISLIFAFSVREPIRRGRGQIVGKPSFAPLFGQLSKERLVYASLILGAVFNATCIYAVVSWFPTLMIRGDGLAPAKVGQLLGTFGTPCGVISCLGSGWLAAWLEKRGRADASVLVALGGAVWFTVMGVGAALVHGWVLRIVGYCLLSLAINCCTVSTFTALNRITPNELRGQIIAVFSLCTGLFSLTVGPFAVGFLSDHFFGPHGGIGKALAAVLAVSGILGVLLYGMGRPRYRELSAVA